MCNPWLTPIHNFCSIIDGPPPPIYNFSLIMDEPPPIYDFDIAYR